MNMILYESLLMISRPTKEFGTETVAALTSHQPHSAAAVLQKLSGPALNNIQRTSMSCNGLESKLPPSDSAMRLMLPMLIFF